MDYIHDFNEKCFVIPIFHSLSILHESFNKVESEEVHTPSLLSDILLFLNLFNSSPKYFNTS